MYTKKNRLSLSPSFSPSLTRLLCGCFIIGAGETGQLVEAPDPSEWRGLVPGIGSDQDNLRGRNRLVQSFQKTPRDVI